MKLAFVEVAGFRGFKDAQRFDFPDGFVVLAGRNGVGKSTVLDAIDFAMTGTIAKYPVKEAKGGGLNEHLWWVGDGKPDDNYVEIGFKDEFGEEHIVRRSRKHGVENLSTSLANRLCAETVGTESWADALMRTTLIRDEVITALSLDLPEQARFTAVRAAIGGLTGTDHSDRTNALVLAAKAAESEQNARLGTAQAELSRTLTALTEARSVTERHSDIASAEQTIKSLEPHVLDITENRAEALRQRVAERKRSIPILLEALTAAEGLRDEHVHFQSQEGQSEITIAKENVSQALQKIDRTKAELEVAQNNKAKEVEHDAFTNHMIALLDHGESVGLQHDNCPLCASARSPNEFATAIAEARKKLEERGARVTAVNAELKKAQTIFQESQANLAQHKNTLEELDTRKTKLDQTISTLGTLFKEWNLEFSMTRLETVHKLIVQRRDETIQLERALFVLEASSAHDRVTKLETQEKQLRLQIEKELGKLSAAERTVETTRQINNAAKAVHNEILTEKFDIVMPLLKELYRRLRPHVDWREIEIEFGGHVRASLNFSVGEGKNPQFLFSSGQRRAAGLAFLLAIHLARPWCKWQTLLLDDPVQHIDDYRALNLVEVLSAIRRTGRQIIVAVEDSALADVLCRRLRSTAVEGGRRFDLITANNGSATISNIEEVSPLPSSILQIASAS